MIIRVICGQKNSYPGDRHACGRRNPSVSSTFNVQVSALQLKSVRAAFNYIKENQCLSVVKKTVVEEILTLIIKEIKLNQRPQWYKIVKFNGVGL